MYWAQFHALSLRWPISIINSIDKTKIILFYSLTVAKPQFLQKLTLFTSSPLNLSPHYLQADRVLFLTNATYFDPHQGAHYSSLPTRERVLP